MDYYQSDYGKSYKPTKRRRYSSSRRHNSNYYPKCESYNYIRKALETHNHRHSRIRKNSNRERKEDRRDYYYYANDYNHHHHNHHHYYSGQKNNKLERSRNKSKGSYKSSKYHNNKYNHHKHQKNKSNLNSYKSKSNYSSNHKHKSSSDISSNKKMDKDHYNYTLGEIIGRKYKLISFISDGTFGRVLNCKTNQDMYDETLYAIKIIRPVKRYIESAEIEARIIKNINFEDKDNKSNCIQMIDSFHFRKSNEEYYAIVFEKVGPSLFDFIKLNNYRGFAIKDLQTIARHMLNGIGYLHKIGIIHTDLKPENILLCNPEYSSTKEKSKWPINVLYKEDKLNNYSPSTRSYSKENEDYYHYPNRCDIKIIDFGGAVLTKNSHRGIINTRQYRSPEVIMECFEWDEKSDVWSIGCILAELYTGELLFATHDNVEHLCLIEKVCGDFPYEMVKHCTRDLRDLFIIKERGGETAVKCDYNGDSKTYSKVFQALKEQETIEELVHPNEKIFGQFLRDLLQINPKKRPNCFQALDHPFMKIANFES